MILIDFYEIEFQLWRYGYSPVFFLIQCQDPAQHVTWENFNSATVHVQTILNHLGYGFLGPGYETDRGWVRL